MKRIVVICAACFLLAAAFAGCAAPAPAQTPDPPDEITSSPAATTSPPVETTSPPAETPRPDPNTEIVKAGEEFAVLEKGNETTGFKWQAIIEDESIVEFVSYEYDPDDTDLVGAGGWTWLRFKALKAGETTVLLEHRRGDRLAETKTITVIVE